MKRPKPSSPPDQLKRCLLLVSCVLSGTLMSGPELSWGATVVLRDEKEPVRGYLHRQDANEVVLRVPGVGGQLELRTIPRDQIDLLIQAVSHDRLEQLDPGQPRAYYEYAEELAAKRVDPEARDASLRLYLIAAHLAPKEMGRAALLGMTQLARDEAEQRRFQAMSFLLDPEHDRRVLAPRELAGDQGDEAQRRDATLLALRMLRMDKRTEALNLARRADIGPVLNQFAETLSFADFEAIAQAVCTLCGRRGRVDCPDCKGFGKIAQNGADTPCPHCNGGQLVCPTCEGNFREYGSSHEVLSRILRVEIALRNNTGSPSRLSNQDARQAGAGEAPSWARVLRAGQIDPVRALDLTTLTDFDPRNSVFRQGKWQRP